MKNRDFGNVLFDLLINHISFIVDTIISDKSNEKSAFTRRKLIAQWRGERTVGHFRHFFRSFTLRSINNSVQFIKGSKSIWPLAALTFTCQPCDWQYFAVTRRRKSFISRRQWTSFITKKFGPPIADD
jgi:hypothetical protein